ncbi:MAG TPA: ATP-binding protein, partial [Geobacteraceae bacterium]|nr:ATP-binding protein [Geobacteraceae bacterium]
ADRDSLKQILFNLWKNSSEAMPSGGSFRIATCGTGQGSEGCGVEIQLSDSGPGIPPDVMERLFQPLDPDRRSANSGVGLSIVASLVEKLGGQIACNSSTGQGTTFTIRLARA